MTKAQNNFIDPGLSDTWCKPMILNKGMTGIWIARRYWLFFYIEEPIYPSVYHVFGGGQDYFLQSSESRKAHNVTVVAPKKERSKMCNKLY